MPDLYGRICTCGKGLTGPCPVHDQTPPPDPAGRMARKAGNREPFDIEEDLDPISEEYDFC